MTFKTPILTIIFYLSVAVVFAQKTDTISRKKDSVRSIQLDSQLAPIQRLTFERIADSLRRAELKHQVDNLSENDAEKRNLLIAELNKLKAKDSLQLVHQKHKIDSLRSFVKGFPITLMQDTLFFIYARQGSFTALERAQTIQNRLHNLATDYSFNPNNLKLDTAEQTVDLIYRDQFILSVSTIDALWLNMDKTKAAKFYRQKIISGIQFYKHETSWQTWLKEIALALLVIVVVILFIYAIRKFFKWLELRINIFGANYFKGFRIRSYEFINGKQQQNLLSGFFNLLKLFLILLVIYLALPVLFGIFPFTKSLSDTLLSYISSPLKHIWISVKAYIPNFITIVILLIVFKYVLKLLRFLKIEIEQGKLKIPGFYADWANPTYQIIRVLVLAFMVIVIFPYLPGSESPVFKGVSVFVGVLFTFSSAGALSNIVAGLVLTYARAFKLGDRVQIGEATGDIIEKTLLVTRIRTIKNEIISIPNATVMSNHTINYSSEAQTNGLIIHTTVTIGYDVPWRQVHELLIAAALKTEFINQTPKPFVLQTSLDDYYVGYQLNAYTNQPNKQATIYSDLHSNIQDNFNKAGVEIMSPHYRALRDGNATSIPSDYLPPDYVPPVFRTEQIKKDK